MKRFFCLVLVCAVLIIFAIFTISTLADENANKTKVKIWVAGAQEGWLISSNLPAEFEAAYPQYSLEITQYPWNTLHDKLIAGFLGGDLPDVAAGADQWVAEFTAIDGLEPMEDFKKVNNYNDSDFVTNSWSHFITIDGTLHAVPMASAMRVLFYRTDLFEKAGISHPPTTLDELIEDGIKLTNGKDQFGLADQRDYLDFHFFSWILYAKGGNFYTPDRTKCTLTDPVAIEALEFYKSLYDKNIIPKDPAQQAETFQGFLQGYYSMAMSGFWWLGLLAAHPEIEGKWATAPLPADKTKITYGHPNGWIIPAKAKNKAGGEAWIQFFLKVKTQVDWYKGVGELPVLLAAYDDPVLKNNPHIPVFLESAKNGMDSLFNIPNGDPVSALVYAMLSNLKSNKVTPEAGAAAVCGKMNDMIKQ